MPRGSALPFAPSPSPPPSPAAAERCCCCTRAPSPPGSPRSPTRVPPSQAARVTEVPGPGRPVRPPPRAPAPPFGARDPLALLRLQLTWGRCFSSKRARDRSKHGSNNRTQHEFSLPFPCPTPCFLSHVNTSGGLGHSANSSSLSQFTGKTTWAKFLVTVSHGCVQGQPGSRAVSSSVSIFQKSISHWDPPPVPNVLPQDEGAGSL